jgi:hypothetical protein
MEIENLLIPSAEIEPMVLKLPISIFWAGQTQARPKYYQGRQEMLSFHSQNNSRHCDENSHSVVILKTVLFTFRHITFKLLSVNCHDMNKRSGRN